MNREQRVRERAYMIWQAEGCPPGCEREHWNQAEREIADELSAEPQSADVDPSGSEQPEQPDRNGAPSRKSAAVGETQPKPGAKRSTTSSAKTSTRRKGGKTPT